MKINDYEKIQIGYYLVQRRDPRVRGLLGRYKNRKAINRPPPHL